MAPNPINRYGFDPAAVKGHPVAPVYAATSSGAGGAPAVVQGADTQQHHVGSREEVSLGHNIAHRNPMNL